jgi:hypothetical protein
VGIFDQILEDVSKELNVSLKEDGNHTCLIDFKEKIKLQIELDAPQENIIIGAIIGELVPGKFRENVLREALKENSSPPPRLGVFAFSPKKNALIFFNKISIQTVDIKNLVDLIRNIVDKAAMWKESIERGDIPQSFIAPIHQKLGGSIFDIKK